MPRKPDRFERETAKINFRLHATAPWLITEPQALRLLRKEHRWVERMIKSQWKEGAFHGSVNYGYNQAIEFFLEQLKQRRK